MGIKYVCDFCGCEAGSGYHRKIDNEILCSNCYDHLKKQTWRLAEDPAVLQKREALLVKDKEKFEREQREWAESHAMDDYMCHRYSNGLKALIRCYNNLVQMLDENIPKGLFFRRPSFTLIDEKAFEHAEERAVDQVYRDVMRQNAVHNFGCYFDPEPCFAEDRMTCLPEVHLPWKEHN